MLERRRQDVCIIAGGHAGVSEKGRAHLQIALCRGLLNIHPVLTLTDGEVTIIGKARGSRQGNNLLVQKIHESGGIDFSMPLRWAIPGSATPCCKVCGRQRPLWENGTEALESRASAASSAPTPVQVPWWRPSSGGEENTRAPPPH
ncbi:MAG: hypothetical protein ACLU38_01795 [Dysosmobacter sp.]